MNKGYKATIVGQIPSDWEMTTVLGIAAQSANAIVGGPFGSDLTSADYVDHGVPVIRGQNLATRVVAGEFVFVGANKARSLESNLARPGDLVFTQRGTLGQVSLVPRRPFDRYLVSQSQMKLTVDRKIADPVFYYYVFTGTAHQAIIRSSTIQTSLPHLNLGILRGIPVQHPLLGEQQAIAEALSDADALIESVEQLIAKKWLVKQGTMQELLTGRRRLPGFSGEWLTKRLEDLADIRSGGTPSTSQTHFWDGEVRWCTPTDITALKGRKYLSDTTRKITQQGLQASAAELIPAKSVVMTSRATIGECAINEVPVSTNQGFKNFVPCDDLDVEFLYYLLSRQKNRLISLCGGSTFLEISKKQVAHLEVRVPATKREQVTSEPFCGTWTPRSMPCRRSWRRLARSSRA